MTTAQQDDSKRAEILTKIKKLLALSESSNEHEAALAMEKAQALMQEYAISEAETMAASGDERAKSMRMAFKVESVPWLNAKLWPWEGWLAVHVSKTFFTHSVNSPNRRVMNFAGREDDAEMSAYVFSYLRHKLDGMARAAFSVHTREYKRLNGRSVYELSNAQAYRSKMTNQAKQIKLLRWQLILSIVVATVLIVAVRVLT